MFTTNWGMVSEIIYQRLEVEFKHANVDYIREHDIHILYKGQEIGTRRMDFRWEIKL